jgi:hypothetical protein
MAKKTTAVTPTNPKIADSYQTVSPASKQEDIVYVASDLQQGGIWTWSNGVWNTKNYVTIDKLYETVKNNYIADKMDKLKRLIFTERYSLEIMDPKDKPDVELSTYILKMQESQHNRMWSKIQMSWYDDTAYGISLFNPVWEHKTGEMVMTKLRHLPAESFGRGTTISRYSDVLQGIVMNEGTQEVEYWQRSRYFDAPVRVMNVFPVKDPTNPGIAGESKVLPITPLITMLDFAWKAQMQQANRIGAPVVFIKVTNPVISLNRNDIQMARDILANWGKDTSFAIPGNMDVQALTTTETNVAQKIIQELTQRLDDYWNPSTFVQQKKGSMGNAGNSQKDFTELWVRGVHSYLEDEWSQIPQMYLDMNGYDGYTARINIPMVQGDRSQLDLQQATAAFTTRVGMVNEIRQKIGLDPLDDAGLAKLKEEYASMNPAPAPSPFGMTNQASRAVAKQADPLEEDLSAIYEELQGKIYGVLKKV